MMKDLDFAFIGQRIREIRNEKMLTQEYIANAVNVNVSHISNIETNKVKVSLSLLVQICNSKQGFLFFFIHIFENVEQLMFNGRAG